MGKVSFLDVVFVTETTLSVQLVHEALRAAQKEYLQHIMDCINVPLVSSDYINNPYSVIVDKPLTEVCGNSVKLFGWYDNEYGYANRMKDFLYKYR